MMTSKLERYCDGLHRRSFLKAGLGGFGGLSLSELLRLRAAGAETGNNPPDTAVIYVEMAGGPSQHETYDPKPMAPQEFRGPLNAIKTNVPGVLLSQYMTEQARIMDKLAVVRSVHHNTGSHRTGAHLTQTGYYLRDRQNRENEMPSIGSVASKAHGPNAFGLPAYVAIPRIMRYGGGAWLGKGYNPFETVRDADRKNFKVPNLALARGLTPDRLKSRKELLVSFDEDRRIVDNRGTAESMDRFESKAFEMITGDLARKAFDLEQEQDETRDRYGRTDDGQNLLLARRLVEHGVTFVTVRIGGWDNHRDLARSMKQRRPKFDQGLAALVEDLHERGLDQKVLVVAMGEFGRTPKINNRGPEPGRDHWGRVMSVLLAGGGLRTGQAIGSSDSKGAVPQDSPYRPDSILFTLYRHLGIDPATTFLDNSGRPRYILEHREPIRELA